MVHFPAWHLVFEIMTDIDLLCFSWTIIVKV